MKNVQLTQTLNWVEYTQTKKSQNSEKCGDTVLLMSSECTGLTQLQIGPKKFIHSLLINIFGINLNEISISG